MNLLRFLILAAGSLTRRQGQANVRQEDLLNSSATREPLPPAGNVKQVVSHQVIVIQAVLLRQANAMPAVLLLVVNVNPAAPPETVVAMLAVSPEASVRLAAQLREDVRREAPAKLWQQQNQGFLVQSIPEFVILLKIKVIRRYAVT
jgi:hypothetical protein